MNEQKNNGRGIFYGVIGVATLVVAIIGATFAYFTATASNNVMTGNMASINLSLAVTKVTDADVTKGGMIPMSNSMVEVAVNTDTSGNEICVDDNGNAVCQVYKIVLTNDSSAGQFVDGYVALRGGSGARPTDLILGDASKDLNGDGICQTVPSGTEGQAGYIAAEPDCSAYSYVAGAKVGYSNKTVTEGGVPAEGTTMRWAQVACTESENKASTCTTKVDQILGTGATVNMASISNATDAKNLANIRTAKSYIIPAKDGTDTNNDGVCDTGETGCQPDSGNPNVEGVLSRVTIAGNNYDAIGTNYIRLSNHAWAKEGKETYDRNADITSALVFNHNIGAKTLQAAVTDYTATYYVVVWLSETGTNQTAGADISEGVKNPVANDYFMGNVTFVSAQGSEVSATFSGYAKVTSDKATS